jgi:hypothetical protein
MYLQASPHRSEDATARWRHISTPQRFDPQAPTVSPPSGLPHYSCRRTFNTKALWPTRMGAASQCESWHWRSPSLPVSRQSRCGREFTARNMEARMSQGGGSRRGTDVTGQAPTASVETVLWCGPFESTYLYAVSI